MLKISIVVVCYNEEKNIAECLESLVSQSYPKDSYEIIVVDGNSEDSTREIVARYVEKYDFIRLVVEPKRYTAMTRNRGLLSAKYDHLAYTDADCVVPEDWLSVMAEGFLKNKEIDPSIVGIGGSNFAPPDSSSFTQAVQIALDTFIGSFGSVTGKSYPEPRYVTDLPTLNVLYEKKVLKKIGLFDESLRHEGEDADLNFRLRKAGFKLFYIPQSYVFHRYRATPGKWWKNMYRYGKARARLMIRDLTMVNILYVAPIVFVLIMAATTLSIFTPFFLIPLVYFPVIFMMSLLACLKKGKVGLTFRVTLAYLLTHFGYGLGEISVLVKALFGWKILRAGGPNK